MPNLRPDHLHASVIFTGFISWKSCKNFFLKKSKMADKLVMFWLTVRLSVCPPVRLSVCPPVRLSVCPSICLSVRPSVRLSVCILFFAILQPTIFKFWILREDYLYTRSTAGFFDSEPRGSGNELRFSIYFINFWEKINVFQLILLAQGYSKIQIFQKKFFLESIGSSW
jgi:hypothetical protein